MKKEIDISFLSNLQHLMAFSCFTDDPVVLMAVWPWVFNPFKQEIRLNNIKKNPVSAKQKLHSVSISKISQLMLLREIIAVYFEKHTSDTSSHMY